MDALLPIFEAPTAMALKLSSARAVRDKSPLACTLAGPAITASAWLMLLTNTTLAAIPSDDGLLLSWNLPNSLLEPNEVAASLLVADSNSFEVALPRPNGIFFKDEMAVVLWERLMVLASTVRLPEVLTFPSTRALLQDSVSLNARPRAAPVPLNRPVRGLGLRTSFTDTSKRLLLFAITSRSPPLVTVAPPSITVSE